MLFGEDNGLKIAPFHIKTIEEEGNEIKFIVAMPKIGIKGSGFVDTGNSNLNHLLQKSVPLNPDYDDMYEIIFEDYAFHITRNESYADYDEQEIRKGDFFLVFERSRLLDMLPQIVVLDLVGALYSNGWKHYGIYCQNHVIDVIAMSEPIVKRYELRN